MDQAYALHRLLWLLALLWFLGQVGHVRWPRGAPPPGRSLRCYGVIVVLAFGALAVWQTFWTLAPERVPAYRQVADRDPRGWRLDQPGDRLEIVDREGQPLVRNVPAERGGWRREYVLGAAAAHLTGYYHPVYGKTGLEAACDRRLARWRQPSWVRLRSTPETGAATVEPLQVTIDVRLQQAAAEALGRRRGAAVVLNPATGEVLALVSSPAPDPNRIDVTRFAAWQRDATSLLLNRALHGRYPPGSTFKAAVAAIALTNGFDPTVTRRIAASGYLPPGDTLPVRDYEAVVAERRGQTYAGHEALDLAEAMARSSNGYFAWLGVELGARSLVRGARGFGFDRALPLVDDDRGGELTGLPGKLPDDLDEAGDVARLAVGQHQLLVTPLAMAQLASTLAAYGVERQPRLIAGGRAVTGEPVIDSETARVVQDLLIGCVTRPHGTCRGMAIKGVPVAAKTGSAENPHGDAHAWVIAFAPASAATVALAVLVENGGSGSEAAVPVGRAILRAAADAGYLLPVEVLP